MCGCMGAEYRRRGPKLDLWLPRVLLSTAAGVFRLLGMSAWEDTSPFLTGVAAALRLEQLGH